MTPTVGFGRGKSRVGVALDWVECEGVRRLLSEMTGNDARQGGQGQHVEHVSPSRASDDRLSHRC